MRDPCVQGGSGQYSISTVNCMLVSMEFRCVGGSAGPCLGVELLVCHPHTFSRRVVVVDRWTMLSFPPYGQERRI